FGFAENTDDLFIGKTLLHGDVLMWLMKTLLTSRCINQRGAGQLKRERIKKKIYGTREEARSDIFDYIEMFYNSKRRHGSSEQMS
ncbi:IS3 family transposase, partial [Enterobacter hormaechei subsp. steigerwaltii]|nr:IS3 family transposase [Enterobacter hormaechei subsp. steigerwaltii]